MSRRPVRSLHVITSTARRGAESFAVDLVFALGEAGHHAEVNALVASDLTNSLPVPVLGDRLLAPGTLRALRRRAAAFDVVVAHGSTTLPACAIALAGSHVPFIYRNIGDPTHWIGSLPRRLRVRWALHRAEIVVALWPRAAATIIDVHRLPAHRVRSVPNGVVAERFPAKSPAEMAAARTQFGLSDAVMVIVCVGALSPEKRLQDAIAATGRLEGALLLVVGDGPERLALEALASEVAPGRVRFLGQVSDVRLAVVAADVLLLPSQTEGLPGVLLEAALIGTPIVASHVGGIPWMLDDGLGGLLVPVADVDALAKAARDAADRSSALVAAARATVKQRFSMPVVAQQWAAIINDVHQTLC